jgi:hypothetical protein
MNLTDNHIEAIRRSGIMDPGAEKLEGDDLYNAACDALVNEAPEVEEYRAVGSYSEEFRILIRGVPGAYFVRRAGSPCSPV